MALSKLEQAVLDQYAPEMCPLCGGDVRAGTNLYKLDQIERDGHTTGRHMPLVVMLCTRCPHVILFHAITLGVSSPAETL